MSTVHLSPERRESDKLFDRCSSAAALFPFARNSQFAIEEFGSGAALGKYEVRIKNYES
jgi:hypothetical protein